MITKKEIEPEVRTKRISDIISSSKFLREPKYYKTNKVSVAARDSWAARGQAGGCSHCNCTNHIYTVYNKRRTSKYNKWHSLPVAGNFCSQCYQELEKQVNYTFTKY